MRLGTRRYLQYMRNICRHFYSITIQGLPLQYRTHLHGGSSLDHPALSCPQAVFLSRSLVQVNLPNVVTTGVLACSVPVDFQLFVKSTRAGMVSVFIRWAASGQSFLLISSKTLPSVLHSLGRSPRQTIIGKPIPLRPRETTGPDIIVVLTNSPGRILR